MESKSRAGWAGNSPDADVGIDDDRMMAVIITVLYSTISEPVSW